MNGTLSAALAAAERGWCVFPCIPGEKRPAVRSDWEARATRDLSVIERHWPQAANVGLACRPSGLVVIDCDVPKPDERELRAPGGGEPGVTDGRDALAWLAESVGGLVEFETYQASTPSGGLHLYYGAPEGLSIRNSASKIAWHVDVRAQGGYVVGPGSTTPQGAYEIVSDLPVAPLPAWLLLVLTEAPKPAEQPSAPTRVTRPPRRGKGAGDRERYRFAALENALGRLLAQGEGGRNCALNAEAFGLVKAGWSPAEVEPVLMDAAGRMGLPEAEARRTLASAFGKGF